MKRNSIFWLIAVLAIAAIIYAYIAYNRKPTTATKLEVAVQTTAENLFNKYAADEKVANSLYLGKVVSVSGNIKSIEPTAIVIGGEGNTSVRCNIDSTISFNTSEIRSGQAIVIKGLCTGYNNDELLGADVILNRCSIEKK